MADVLPAIEIETAPRPDAAVIWLHGLGDTGDGWSQVVPGLRLPATMAVRFVFPHAPAMFSRAGMHFGALFSHA